MTTEQPRNNQVNLQRRNYLWLASFLFFIGIMYILTLSRNHTEGEDSIYYIMSVTNWGESFYHFVWNFHPNHLFFNPVNRLFYNLWIFFGYKGSAEIPMQILTVITSITTLALTYLLGVKIGIKPSLAFLPVGWLAFSFGFWIYGVEAETYIPPLPFLLICVYILVNIYNHKWEETGKIRLKSLLGLGLFSACAVLIHQQYVFLLVVVSLTLLTIWRKFEHASGLKFIFSQLAVFWGTAFVIIGTAYLSVSYLVFKHSSLAETIEWAKGHANRGFPEPLSWTSPFKAIIGIFKVIWGTNFLFASPHISSFVERIFPNKLLLEEQYVANKAISSSGLLLISIATIVGIVSALILLSKIVLATYKKSAKTSQRDSLSIESWIFSSFSLYFLATYAVVITIFQPTNIEYWISLLPIFYLWLAQRLTIIKQPSQTIGLILMISLYLANFLGGAWPYSQRSTDYWYVSNEYLLQNAQPEDLIVTECGFICQGYLVFYTKAEVLLPSSRDSNILKENIKNHQTGRVIISSWAFVPPKGLGHEIIRNRDDQEVKQTLETFRDSFREIASNEFQTLWQIERKQ